MTSVEKVIDVQIDVKSKAPTRASFGTPMLVCVCPFQDIVREYDDPDTMLDDGFDPNSAAYSMALTMWAQQPHPQTFKVGKRKNIPQYKYTLTPVNLEEDFVYEFDIKGTTISYEVPAAATPTTVATALQLLIDAIGGITAAVILTDRVEVTNTEFGEVHSIDLSKMDPIDDLRYKNTTSDPGIEEDLVNIYKVDPDWYGLLVDIKGSETVEIVAAWGATKNILTVFDNYDTGVIDVSVSDDIFSELQASSYSNIVPIWRRAVPYQSTGNADAAWLSLMLTFDPGTATWAFKTLTGVPVDNLQTGWESQIESKGGNYYSELAGVGSTLFGITSSGEFADITRFVDYLVNTIAIEVLRVKLNSTKVPFTDKGISLLVGAVQTVLGANTATPEEPNKGLAPEPPPKATAPAALGLPVADRVARVLDSISFTANLAGAIHKTKVRGTISI